MQIYNGLLTDFFAKHTVLGYMAVALLAFALGVLITLFCFRIRKHREEKKND